MGSSTYKYKPLDLSTDSIRLVVLLKGYSIEPIRCKVWETWVHEVEGVPYEALSYVWGDPENAGEIAVDGLTLRVTSNLYTALQHLRCPDRDRVMWVDGYVLIKTSRKSKGTSNEIDYLMDSAQDWINTSLRGNKDLEWRPHQLGGTDNSTYTQKCTSLQNLLDKSWFDRVWIIQEVASARVGTVVCGRKSISTQAFLKLPSFLQMEPDDSTQAILDIMSGQSRKQSWWCRDRDLGTLIRKFRHSKATNPLDHIYALVGISSDACKKGIFYPDYEKTQQEVVRTAI
ncbi:Fc.00g024110.m01.CDS01 [Cosmosporella sp. VM-42]